VTDIQQKLLAAFAVEYKEHLDHIRRGLRASDAVTDTGQLPDLSDIYRRAHSLKGAARAVGLDTVEKLAHGLESFFSQVQKGDRHLDGKVTSIIYLILDAIEDWIGGLSDDGAPENPDDAFIALRQLLENDLSIPTEKKQPNNTQNGRERPVARLPKIESVRIQMSELDRLMQSFSDLHTDSRQQKQLSQNLRDINRQCLAFERSWVQARRLVVSAKSNDGSNENLSLLERLNCMDSDIQQLSGQIKDLTYRHTRDSWTLRKHVEQLENDVKRVRMVTAETAFGGFPTMVRDLARDQKKQIEMTVDGLQTQADRRILQEIKDPVMHILRNAVSHGIEPNDVRKKAGKNPLGRIELIVAPKDNRLIITVNDDGNGLSSEMILETAVRSKRLTSDEAGGLAAADLSRLLFEPGFSTAREISEISGRGYGLSAVQEAVRSLHGTVEIMPRQPCGVQVIISVPLAISAERLLLIQCQEHTLGVPVRSIESLHRVQIDNVKRVEERSMIMLNGEMLPFVTLSHLLGLPASDTEADDGYLPVMVTRAGDHKYAISVDQLLATSDDVITEPCEGLENSDYWGGVIFHENGAPAIVLSIESMIRALENGDAKPFMYTNETRSIPKTPIILVVDDSITTRTLEKSILEAHGFEVRLCVDGEDALNHLRIQSVDLVVSDVEMPRVDGFELLRRIKADRRLVDTPVILVTSRDDPVDRRRGLELGAGAYIVKQRFDQQDLLTAIRQML